MSAPDDPTLRVSGSAIQLNCELVTPEIKYIKQNGTEPHYRMGGEEIKFEVNVDVSTS
jgi:hypothetical protein